MASFMSPYATRFKEYFSRYMKLDPAVYVGGSVKNPAHKIVEFINEKGERESRTLKDHEKEDYISFRIKQVINDDPGQLSRLFDQIAIPDEDMASEFLQAEEAQKNGTAEEHLISVVLQASQPFLEADKKKLNAVAINAIGIENYQKIVAKYLHSHSEDKVTAAEEVIADQFIQAIAANYPQKLIEYNDEINAHNKDEYFRYYNQVISPLNAYIGKITGTVLSQPAVKKLSITELLPLFDTMEKKLRATLNSLNEYKNLYPKDGEPKVLAVLAKAIDLVQGKLDDIETIHALRDEGVPVEHMMQDLLKVNHDQEIQKQFKKYLDEYLNQVIRNVVEYQLHLAHTCNELYEDLEPLIQEDANQLINLKGNVNNLSDLEEELRKLPIVSLAQYHQDYKANINDREMQEIIRGKTAAILIELQSRNELAKNRTDQTVLKGLNLAQRAQAEVQEDKDVGLSPHVKIR